MSINRSEIPRVTTAVAIAPATMPPRCAPTAIMGTSIPIAVLMSKRIQTLRLGKRHHAGSSAVWRYSSHNTPPSSPKTIPEAPTTGMFPKEPLVNMEQTAETPITQTIRAEPTARSNTVPSTSIASIFNPR